MKLRWMCLSLAAALGVSMSAPLPSKAEQSSDCASGQGEKVPVLMVHGLNSNTTVWKSDGSSLEAVIGRVKDAVIVTPFDYEHHNNEWVTSKQIGPALAEYIDCLAQNSLKSGGKGKVIVLAHSMGGLATRYAANQTVGGRKVADSLGLVITIGTPHAGSLLANLCNELAKVNAKPGQCQGTAIPALKMGSKELAALPPFPPSVPVKSIVGDVTLNAVILPPVATLPTYTRIPLDSDIVVPVRSASMLATESGRGDGGKRFSCDGWIPIPSHSDAPCEHNNLLKMPEVQEEVRVSIEQYMNSLKEKSPATSSTPTPKDEAGTFTFQGLRFTLGDSWQLVTETDNHLAFMDRSDCRDAANGFDCPRLNFFMKETLPPYRSPEELLEDFDNCIEPPSRKEARTIDGRTVQYVESDPCKTPGSNRSYEQRMWALPGRLLIYVTNPRGHIARSVDSILDNAVWEY
ncbi:MAG TPA: hypothetical protein VFT59_04370 [Candidatus Saccharimonadales bacterium]|nr:hypothetical protein [Candidatus Saccharimonadales bacterium]